MRFSNRNEEQKYHHLDLSYFVKIHSKSNTKYKQNEIIQVLHFLVDNIFVLFGGRVSQQMIGIPMGSKCAPLLVDLFLHTNETDFPQEIL